MLINIKDIKHFLKSKSASAKTFVLNVSDTVKLHARRLKKSADKQYLEAQDDVCQIKKDLDLYKSKTEPSKEETLRIFNQINVFVRDENNKTKDRYFYFYAASFLIEMAMSDALSAKKKKTLIYMAANFKTAAYYLCRDFKNIVSNEILGRILHKNPNSQNVFKKFGIDIDIPPNLQKQFNISKMILAAILTFFIVLLCSQKLSMPQALSPALQAEDLFLPQWTMNLEIKR